MEAIIDGCMSADDGVRRNAEAALKGAAANPAALVAELLRVLSGDAGDGRRGMAAVLLRLHFNAPPTPGTGVGGLQPPQEAELKTALLRALTTEANNGVRRKVCHVVAQVAARIAGAGFVGWPELLPSVFTLAQHSDETARELALFLFRQLVIYCGVASVQPHSAGLKEVLGKLLGDPSVKVAAAALQGTSAMIETLEDEAQRRPYLELMPLVLTALGRALGPGGDEEAAREALGSLIELIQQAPGFMREYLQPAASAMLQIINHEGFEEDTRALGLEFLVQMAENAGASVRKFPELIQHVLTLSLRFITPCAEDAAWASKDTPLNGYYLADGGDDEDDDMSQLLRAGTAAVDRLATAVGAKLMTPALQAAVGPMLANQGDWKQRRAGLMAMSLALLGCKKTLLPAIETVVSQFRGFLADPHPRVRFAAVRLLDQMAEDYADPNADDEDGGANAELAAHIVSKGQTGAAARASKAEGSKLKGLWESSAAKTMLTDLIGVVSNPAEAPRLRGAAAQSIATLMDEAVADSDTVQPLAKPLMEGLFGLLQSLPANFTNSQGAALAAIANTASVMGDDFQPYYAPLMPPLKALISASVGPDKKYLRNRALDCLSRVCEAVGREVAGVDAAQCLNLLLTEQKAAADAAAAAAAAGQEVKDADDEETANANVSALHRLAECLGADFIPYVPFILHIYQSKAEQKVKVEFTKGEDDNDPNAMKVAVDSNKLMDKIVGTRMLVALVQSLGMDVPQFWPFLDHIAGVLMGLMDTNLWQVRELAVVGLSSCLMYAMGDYNDLSHGQKTFDLVFAHLAQRLGEGGERTRDILNTAAEAVEEALKHAHESNQPGYKGPGDWDGQKKEAAASAPARTYGRVVLSKEQLLPLFIHLNHCFTKCVARRAETAQEAIANPDADEEDAAKLAQDLGQEDELLSHCTDAMGYAVKLTRDESLGALSQSGLGQTVMGWLDKKDDWDVALRACALCLADDLIEFASPMSHSIIPQVMPHMLECAASKHAKLRHPATYGLGVLAQHGGDAFTPFVPASLAALQAAVAAPDARVEDNAFATDNAVSSVIKMAKFRPGQVDVEAIMTAALPFLPFRFDAIEGCLVHGWMVEGLGAMEPLWVGPGGARMPALLAALGRALAAHKANVEASKAATETEDEGADDEEPLFEDKHIAALPAIAQAIRASPHAAQFAALLAALSKKEKAALAHYGFTL